VLLMFSLSVAEDRVLPEMVVVVEQAVL